ncbi:MAG TPA: hypothetical protein VGH99_18220 [Pseudonocardia sp.]|jgi:hypothetical protein
MWVGSPAAGSRREIDWHRVDHEVHAHFNQELGAMGAFLSGRVTHELMAAGGHRQGQAVVPPGGRALDLRLDGESSFGNGVVLLRYRPASR